MLNGIGAIQDGSYTFTFEAPLADGIDVDSGFETRTSHNAYTSGMSRWCANCHGPVYHSMGSGSVLQHPTNRALGNEVSAQYNRYDGDDNPIGGSQATSYLPEVPFEDPLVTTTSTSGPTPSSRISCLSCHRAHGSSSPAAGRWDFNVAELGQDGMVSGSYAIPNPYSSPSQGPLCNKCHAGGASGADGVTFPQPQP
jgi:hypothetical protein